MPTRSRTSQGNFTVDEEGDDVPQPGGGTLKHPLPAHFGFELVLLTIPGASETVSWFPSA